MFHLLTNAGSSGVRAVGCHEHTEQEEECSWVHDVGTGGGDLPGGLPDVGVLPRPARAAGLCLHPIPAHYYALPGQRTRPCTMLLAELPAEQLLASTHTCSV